MTRVTSATVCNAETQQCSDAIQHEQAQHSHCQARRHVIHMPYGKRHAELVHQRAYQQTAQYCPQNNRTDRGALKEPVCLDQIICMKHFSNEAVFGRCIHCRAQTRNSYRYNGIQSHQHEDDCAHLEKIGDQHDTALGYRVSQRADKRCEQHVEHDEGKFEDGNHPVCSGQFKYTCNGNNQKCIVCQG